ncbi:MAG: hypothetical protein KIS62_15425 [Ramlibacter sp.]|nr:hypothetical protein [Ramlibacter sp.]
MALLLALGVVGCGGGGDGAGGSGGPYSVGGTVAGLAGGTSVVLANNGADPLTMGSNGSFTFSALVARDAAYAVTVKTQPSGQICAVARGTGTATADVADVAVSCQALAGNTVTLGGTVTGLQAGTTLVLQNNAGNDLSVGSNGGFTFSNPVAAGSAYAVTVKTQPAGQTCTVTAGSGTANGSVSGVSVACVGAVSDIPLGTAGLAGDWLQGQCSAVGGGRSGRVLVRAANVTATSLTYQQSVMFYENSTCAGTGSLNGITTLGTFVVARSGATANVVANWGTFTGINGVASPFIWARKRDLLCLLGDSNPSVLPTAADVEAHLAIVPEWACYAKQ